MSRSLHIVPSDGISAIGIVVLNARSCEFDAFIDRAVAAVHLMSLKKDIRFARVTGGDGLRVIADPEKGAWVVATILAHAVQRSPLRGVVTMDVRIGAEEITLTFLDQGPPLDVEESDHDLHIAAEFMEAMGGSYTGSVAGQAGATQALTFKRA